MSTDYLLSARVFLPIATFKVSAKYKVSANYEDVTAGVKCPLNYHYEIYACLLE